MINVKIDAFIIVHLIIFYYFLKSNLHVYCKFHKFEFVLVMHSAFWGELVGTSVGLFTFSSPGVKLV
jgi:hypothetical protein